MKKCLKSFVNTIYHMVDGVRVSGIHNKISGDVSRISGDVSGISGNVSGISGNVDDAKLTEAERKAGVDILSLVK